MWLKIKPYLIQLLHPLYRVYCKILQEIVSRKMIVFMTATALLIGSFIGAEYWVAIAFALLGIHAYQDKQAKFTAFHDSAKLSVKEDYADTPTDPGI